MRFRIWDFGFGISDLGGHRAWGIESEAQGAGRKAQGNCETGETSETGETRKVSFDNKEL